MTDRAFKTFIIFSLVITLALSGLSFAKSESVNHHVAHNQVVLSQTVTQQAKDREAAILKNVEARREDCENNNSVRAALREQVEEGKRETPLLLKLVPALNTKEILSKAAKQRAKQLKAYAPLNCEAYAHRALPPSEVTKITLTEQQSELHKLIVEAAVSRITTVGQRCELTGLITQTTHRFKLPEASKYEASYKACLVQLHRVERQATEAQ